MLTSKNSIFVAGHQGLVGSSMMRGLQNRGYSRIITRTRSELDLLDQKAVRSFFEKERPEYVLLAAAKVGGIRANNDLCADFIYENLTIETNVLHSACMTGTKHLLFLSSACVYPKMAPQPIREDSLLTGPLEPTNAPFAISKIAGISLCESFNRQYGTEFRPVMATNLYGPHDNFDLEHAHVLPALMRRFHEAKLAKIASVTLWGTGKPQREFLYVDDLTDACIFLMEKDRSTDLINIGTGEEVTIKELSTMVADVVGFTGTIAFDATHPDGTPRKVVDCSKIHALGWKPKTALKEGLKKTYEWFLAKKR